MTTTTPTTDRPRTALRLEHTRELLTLLPYQLGFHPRDSVVLVALRPRRGVGLVARVDLRDLLAPDGPEIAASAVAHLEADGAQEVVVVVYGDEDDPREPARGMRVRPGGEAVRAAEVARAAGAAVGAVTVWYVARGQYLGLDCRERGCCPPGGRPLADLTGGELAGRLMGRGEVAATRDEVGAIPPAPPGPRRAAAGARSRWFDALLRTDDDAGLLRWRQQSLGDWRSALASAREDPAAPLPVTVLGRVEAALHDPVVRDAVFLTLVGDDEDLPDALLRAAPAGLRLPGRSSGTAPGSVVERAGEVLRDEEADRGEDQDAAASQEAAGADATGPDAAGPDAARPDAAGPDAADHDEDQHGSGHDAAAHRDAVDHDEEPDRGVDDPEVKGDAEDRVAGDAAPGRARPEGAHAVSGRVRDALDLMVDPGEGREPDDARLAAARAVLERVVAHGRRERQAPALTVLALLAWWGGDAVRASVLVERALCHDPGHRLAELLDRALGAGLPPGWLRRRC